MRRDLVKRLDQVEQYRKDDTVRQISALMDELSAKAAGQTTQDLGSSEPLTFDRFMEGLAHDTP